MRNRKAIDKTFSVERGRLVRTVKLADGRSYTHRCELEAYRAVAWFVVDTAETSETASGHDRVESTPGAPVFQQRCAGGNGICGERDHDRSCTGT